MLTLAIDPETERRLEALGATSESSKTAWLEKTVLDALQEMEGRMAEARLSRPEKGTQEKPRPKFGSARDHIRMSDDFDQPLEDFEALADQLADELEAARGPNARPLPDEAMTREGIYGDHP